MSWIPGTKYTHTHPHKTFKLYCTVFNILNNQWTWSWQRVILSSMSKNSRYINCKQLKITTWGHNVQTNSCKGKLLKQIKHFSNLGVSPLFPAVGRTEPRAFTLSYIFIFHFLLPFKLGVSWYGVCVSFSGMGMGPRDFSISYISSPFFTFYFEAVSYEFLILLPQPPRVLRLQVCTTMPSFLSWWQL